MSSTRTPAPASPAGARDPGARFASRLFQALPGDRNVVVSPASVRLALAMAAEGARGETEAELRDALGLADPASARRELAAQLRRWEALAQPPSPNEQERGAEPWLRSYLEQERRRAVVKLAIANRLWPQRGSPLRAEYVALLRESYGAPLSPVDFAVSPEEARAEINGWVRAQTGGRIPELIEPGRLERTTRLALTNTVHFKAAWSMPFEPQLTKEGAFHLGGGGRSLVPFMETVCHAPHAALPGGHLLELAYGRGPLAMDVILPAHPGGLAALEEGAVANLEAWCAALRAGLVRVALPRWKATARLELNEALGRLGVTTAFRHPGADFSGMDGTRELYLSSVLHEATIEVDEHGTEAAAATAVVDVMGPPGPAEPSFTFRADRPFLYAIRDTETGAILFMGRVVDPAESPGGAS